MVPASSGRAVRSSVLLAAPCSSRCVSTAAQARSSHASPSTATPAFWTSAIRRRRSLSATRSLAAGWITARSSTNTSHSVRRIARCLTTERRRYSCSSRVSVVKPGLRAHRDRYGVAGSVACKPTSDALIAVRDRGASATRKWRRANRFRRSSTLKERTSAVVGVHGLADLRKAFCGRSPARLVLLLDGAALRALGVEFGGADRGAVAIFDLLPHRLERRHARVVVAGVCGNRRFVGHVVTVRRLSPRGLLARCGAV